MRLVLAALGRPLTVIVALIAIIAGFFMAIGRMRMDIFPEVGNPVIYVAQPYGGMTPAQMEGFLTYYYEYHFLYITGIQAVDSKSVQGAALMKLTFRSCRWPPHGLHPGDEAFGRIHSRSHSGGEGGDPQLQKGH